MPKVRGILDRASTHDGSNGLFADGSALAFMIGSERASLIDPW
jgi:prepilin-type processing-associated H-X9-DG protein